MTNVSPTPIRRGKYIDFAPRASKRPQNAQRSISAVLRRSAPKVPLEPASGPQTFTVRQHFDTPTHHVHQSITESTEKTDHSVSFSRSTTTVAVPNASSFEDTPPLMNDDDLEAALAGFVDDTPDLPPVSDEESPEPTPVASDDNSLDNFTDELDALEQLTDDLSASGEDELDALSEEADLLAGKHQADGPLAETPVETSSKSPESPSAPDNSRFVLGGRSPFLTNVSIDKRPLSEDFSEQAVEQAIEEEKPKKNSYLHRKLTEEKEKKPKKEKKPATIVISTPDKASNFGLVVAIILTVILGSAVGAIAYLAFFQ